MKTFCGLGEVGEPGLSLLLTDAEPFTGGLLTAGDGGLFTSGSGSTEDSLDLFKSGC